MARKTLGYVNLIWTCQFCQTQNPGPIKSCTACGSPQPPEVQFEKVDQANFDFIKDEALIRMAKAGPDKHCPYCGTRNTAAAERCIECGSDITVDAKARQVGQVVGSQQTEQAPPKPAKKMSKGLVIGLILGFIILCIGSIVVLVNLFKTETYQGKVSQTTWERVIVIEGFSPVSGQAWIDEIPADANLESCSMRYRYTSDEPQANATEVCSEPYTIDTGTGAGQVVQDCTYEVYDDYCSYSGYAWVEVDQITSSGYDNDPYWPQASLSSTERMGEQTERLVITFNVDGDQYTFTTTDLALFQQAYPGSAWELEINNLDRVTSATPK